MEKKKFVTTRAFTEISESPKFRVISEVLETEICEFSDGFSNFGLENNLNCESLELLICSDFFLKFC